jgi:cell division protein FtsL
MSRVSANIELQITSSAVSFIEEHVRPEFNHHQVNQLDESPLTIANDIYSYVRNFSHSSHTDFPDSLLDNWQLRLDKTLDEINVDKLRSLDSCNRDQLVAQRDQLVAQRDQLVAQRDQLVAQRDQLVAERDQLVAQRDQLVAQRDQLVAQRDQLVAQRDELVAQRDSLLSSTIWKFTKPLRQLIDLLRRM